MSLGGLHGQSGNHGLGFGHPPGRAKSVERRYKIDAAVVRNALSQCLSVIGRIHQTQVIGNPVQDRTR